MIKNWRILQAQVWTAAVELAANMSAKPQQDKNERILDLFGSVSTSISTTAMIVRGRSGLMKNTMTELQEL